MRKNINKIVAFAIGISIMSGSVMPVFADDTVQSSTTQNSTAQSSGTEASNNTNEQANINTKESQVNQGSVNNKQIINRNILTLNNAIDSAISISDTLALDEKKISYQDKFNDIKEKQDDFNDVDDDVEDYDDDTSKIKLNQAKQQKDFDEDLLRKKVTDKYNDIVTNQMKINQAAKQLEIKNKGLADDKLRESLGIKRLYDVKSTQLDIEKSQNAQKSSQNALKDLQYSFKVLTGKDASQYTLEQDIKFEPLNINKSIDEYLDTAIDSYLKYSEQLVKLNKDYYDKDYEKDNGITSDDLDDAEKAAKSATKPSRPAANDPDPNAGENYQSALEDYNNKQSNYSKLLASRLTYLNTKLSNYQSETNLSENKKKFKDQLKTIYTNLLTSEDNINYYKKNIELANENLSSLKLKYDLGMTTESDYSTQVLNNNDLDIQLRSEIINYNKLKEQIQKPWVAFSSGQ